MEKLYTIAGVSRVDGELTYRFASGTAQKREGVLRRAGHREIRFLDLPNAMTLEQAVAWLISRNIHAVLPRGQRRGENGGTVRGIEVKPVQQDAHVRAYNAAREADAKRREEFVARMAAARAAKRLLAEAAATEQPA